MSSSPFMQYTFFTKAFNQSYPRANLEKDTSVSQKFVAFIKDGCIDNHAIRHCEIVQILCLLDLHTPQNSFHQ